MPVAFTSLVTEVWDQVGTTVTTISGSAILMIPIGLGFVGGVIGITKKLMGTRRRR